MDIDELVDLTVPQCTNLEFDSKTMMRMAMNKVKVMNDEQHWLADDCRLEQIRRSTPTSSKNVRHFEWISLPDNRLAVVDF